MIQKKKKILHFAILFNFNLQLDFVSDKGKIIGYNAFFRIEINWQILQPSILKEKTWSKIIGAEGQTINTLSKYQNHF